MAKRYITIIISYFILLFSGILGVPLVAAILNSFSSASKTEIANLSVVIWSILANIASLCIIWLLLRNQPEFNKIATGQKAGLPSSILWAVGGFFILLVAQYVAVFVITIFAGLPSGSENTADLLGYSKTAPIFLIFISILGPILEELVFRKVLYGGLANIINIHVAAVISSFVFALLHGDIQYLLSYFLIGLILCYLYTKTKRIIVPMFAHILMNSFVIILSLFFWG
ncbi:MULTISPECIES: CPBP family intramembrane glutamic endopeptidase [Listeria]|uniref:CPBP family intramembrane glutamic endopeptidase n=1 Tax=Listeria TaxID=1637 RepID=UPI000B590D9B|nr:MULTISPECIES: type II CAAX endopeptidase family protein [Listeria]